VRLNLLRGIQPAVLPCRLPFQIGSSVDLDGESRYFLSDFAVCFVFVFLMELQKKPESFLIKDG